jgi:hypothetical protein
VVGYFFVLTGHATSTKVSARAMSFIGFDWVITFYPVTWWFLHGGDPYAAPIPLGVVFSNPPWILPLLVPFALLPPTWGAIGMALISLTGLCALAYKLRRPWLIPLVGLSYVMLEGMANGTVDGLALWGLALGGPVGFFLLSVKPQVASLVGVVWMWQAYQQDAWRGVLKLAGPTTAVGIVFTALYPQWVRIFFAVHERVASSSYNLWPWLIPVAVLALWWALRRGKPAGAAVATTLSAPYILAHSYVGALALVADELPVLGIILAALSWALILLR